MAAARAAISQSLAMKLVGSALRSLAPGRTPPETLRELLQRGGRSTHCACRSCMPSEG